jgi:hypothetical protein
VIAQWRVILGYRYSSHCQPKFKFDAVSRQSRVEVATLAVERCFR